MAYWQCVYDHGSNVVNVMSTTSDDVLKRFLEVVLVVVPIALLCRLQ